MNNDFNKQLEALKRQISNVVADMHARKMAIPAGALIAAIVMAVVLLPKGSSAPVAPPVASAPPVTTKTTPVAQVSLIAASTINEDTPLSNSSDPFIGYGDYKCVKVSSNPDTYNCKVSDLMLRVICTEEASTGPCAPSAATGSTGAAGGATGEAGGGGSTQTTGGNGKTKTKSKTKTSTYYVVTVSINDTTKKDVQAGDALPKESNALVVYAGTNDAHSRAIFIMADGVTVAGVKVDETFGSFSLKKGESATLTDISGAEHKLTLKRISRVTK